MITEDNDVTAHRQEALLNCVGRVHEEEPCVKRP